MDMEDFLAGIPGRVEDDPEARLGDAFFPSRPAGREQELTEQGFRSFGSLVERGEVDLGDDEDVDRGLGPEVLEGENALGLEEDLRRELPARNTAEEAVAGGRSAHDLILSIEAPRPRSLSSIRS